MTTKSDIAADRAYLNGLRAGWNYGIRENAAGYMVSEAQYIRSIHDGTASVANEARPSVQPSSLELMEGAVLGRGKGWVKLDAGRWAALIAAARRESSALNQPAQNPIKGENDGA